MYFAVGQGGFLIDGMRSGRVFIDLEGDKNHFLDLAATDKDREV
jgi:hypothetical protein